MSRKKSDIELVEAMQGGCRMAFEELVQRYTARVYSLATRLTRNPEDAEEVLQDVFVTVHRKIGGFEGKSSFSSWLYRVAVNAAFMKLRKRRQDHSIALEDLAAPAKEAIESRTSEDQDLDNVTSQHELFDAVEDALKRLPDEYRGVFVLRDIDGLTSREVGEMLDLSIPAVKSRLHRSRLMLRRRLRSFYREYTAGGSEKSDDGIA